MMTGRDEQTLDEWKAKVRASFHVRKGDEVVFTESRDGVIGATIKDTSVYLGSYFTEDDRLPGKMWKAGTGWLHT